MDNLEKMKEFAESIPMEELFDEIRHITALNDLKFTYKIIERNNYIFIEFKSQDIVDKVGFLKLIFSTLTIEQFNSEIRQKEEKFFYWGTVDFRYTHTKGGCNGYKFLDFMYDEIHGWKFED